MEPLTRRDLCRGAGGLLAGLAGASLLPGRAAGGPTVPWGVAVEHGAFSADPAYRAAIASTAGLVTPMNALKWGLVRHERGRFDFAKAETLVAFAEGRGLPVHGHALLWYAHNPGWVEALRSRSEAAAVLEEHVARVVGRFSGRIRSWDVVNEVVAHDPSAQGPWREGVWQRLLGPAQVEIAFRAAHAADPAARLYVNDYDLEDDSARTRARQDAVLAIVDRLQRRGVPVHGVGMQAHLYGERAIGAANLRRFLRGLKARGVGVAVTELDVIDWRLPEAPPARDRAAADLVDRFLGTLFEEVTPDFVTTWGLSDRYSWIHDAFPRGDGARARPLPLDVRLERKPMYRVIRRYTG